MDGNILKDETVVLVLNERTINAKSVQKANIHMTEPASNVVKEQVKNYVELQI